MADRNILAFFNSPEQAEKALSQMRELKLIDTQIKRVDGFPGDGMDHIDNPLTGDFDSLAALTLNGDTSDRHAGILTATHVSASGMSTGGPDNVMTGKDILLTVVVDEADYDRAMDIVQKAGAQV